jgi:hypothetical protein
LLIGAMLLSGTWLWFGLPERGRAWRWLTVAAWLAAQAALAMFVWVLPSVEAAWAGEARPALKTATFIASLEVLVLSAPLLAVWAAIRGGVLRADVQRKRRALRRAIEKRRRAHVG